MASNETIGSSIPSTETTKFPFPGYVCISKKLTHDFYSTTGEKRKEQKRCEKRYVSFGMINNL
jgi:hypothetical protein